MVLDDLATAVTNTVGVQESAVLALNGVAARIQAAVDAAVAGGATVAQLAPVQAEVDALNASSTALAQAVAANSGVVAGGPGGLGNTVGNPVTGSPAGTTNPAIGGPLLPNPLNPNPPTA